MKKFLKITFGLIILGVFVWTLFFLYQKSEEKPITFDTESLFITDIIKKTVATGAVVPRKEISITAKVSGIIDKIYVEAGENVKAGDIIARVKIIPNVVALNNAESRVNKAKIRLENSKIEYERSKKLYDEQVVPLNEFQTTELNYKTAQEEVVAAENNLALIKEGATKDKKNVTNTLVRSTISGMVLDVPVEEGNSVIESNTFNEGTMIASIANMGEMVFEGKVDESEVGKIHTGMNLILKVGAIEDKTFKAKLEYISPKGVEENGAIQFEIKASVELDPDFFIRAGYSANADIVLDRRDSVLAIKESTLKFENDSTYIEIENNPQEFEKIFIETGLSDGINIEILSDLDTNTQIKGLPQEEVKSIRPEQN